MNTTENNKLIAEFMEFEPAKVKQPSLDIDDRTTYGVYFVKLPHFDGVKSVELLRFHESWDWLMPVFEKIGSLTNQHGFKFTWSVGKYACIESSNYSVIEKKFFANSDTPIISAYNCALKFIKWYNENK